MPTRTCRPMAIAIAFNGSTLRIFDRQDGAVRDSADELHHVVGVGTVHAAADRCPVHGQRAGVDAAPDQALDRLELPHVAEHEQRLDAVGLQPAQVFLDEAGPEGMVISR